MTSSRTRLAIVAGGRLLKRRRQSAGLGTQALAEAIGVHRETILGYEAGRTSIPDERIVSIAKALGLDAPLFNDELRLAKGLTPRLSKPESGPSQGADLVDVAVGRVLVRIRQAYGLSRLQLSRRCTISVHRLRKVEDGWSSVSISMLVNIADALELSSLDLMAQVIAERDALRERSIPTDD